MILATHEPTENIAMIAPPMTARFVLNNSPFDGGKRIGGGSNSSLAARANYRLVRYGYARQVRGLFMRWIACGTAALLAVMASEVRAESVPGGIYLCFGRSAVGGRGPDVEGAGRGGRDPYISEGAGRGAVSGSASKFAVIGEGRYLSRGGAEGNFSFDGLTLTMMDGPYTGLRFHKVSPEWTFRELGDDGEEDAVMCPRNTSKDPLNPETW